MSAPGRPQRESPGAQREAAPVSTCPLPLAERSDAPPSVNGVALAAAGETPAPDELRRRACTELLRQQAMRAGLLPADDPAPRDGAISERANDAIEALLERAVAVPPPDEAACRRHYDAQSARLATGERVRLRHVLFAVTPGVDVGALRRRAEACLLDLRARGTADDRHELAFAAAARELSNCPSGAAGGDLGWVEAQDCAPEFAREVFGRSEVGVLARLVASRFGLHVVEVLARTPGRVPPFDAVRGAIAQSLHQQAFATALRQYLQRLASEATVEGVALDRADLLPIQ